MKNRVCYSAGPGSGKTRTLVEEFEKRLKETGYDFEGVVAITFTDKAANEMVERVAQKIRENAPDEFMKFISSHRIGTIHSFCLSILKNHITVSSEIIDDKAAAVLKERAIELSMGEILKNETLLDNFGAERIREDLRKVLDRRYLYGIIIPDKVGYMKSNEEALNALTIPCIEEFKRIPSERLGDSIEFYEKLQNYESLSFGEKLYVIRKICEMDLRKISGRGMSDIKKKLKELYEDCALTENNFESVLDYEYSVLRELDEAIELVKGNYEKIKGNRMDFDDILIRTSDLLKNKPDVAQIEGKRIKFLFVDEFQDVDPLQYEIIELLGVENTIVFGDPKQSIYSFRGADVELFNMVAKDKNYERRELDKNYRSTPRLIKFFNSATKNVFVEEAEGYKTPYQKLEADRSDFQSRICFDIAIKQDNEAELIAKRIESIAGALDVWRDDRIEKAEYGDIAILVDSTTYMQELTRALIEHNIPYQVLSGSGFFEAPEIKALTNLLYALEDPYDDIALFGLLRSELFHLSDEEIYEISKEDISKEDISKENEIYLYDRLSAEVREYLEKYLSLVDLIKPSELLSKIVRERSYRAILAIGDRRDVSVKNVNKFIALIRSFESSGVRSMHTICEMLSRFTELKVREPEAGVSKENCVTIITIHKAKGLEWPVVIVPYIYKRYRNNSEEILIKKSHIGIRTNIEPFSARRRSSLIAIKLRDDERRRYEEERKRVLYVAMTRARDHLFFTGSLNININRYKCWATEVFDKSDTLMITQIARSSAMEKELHFAFDGVGLRPVHLNPPAEKLKPEREEEPKFINYEPPGEKIVLDPSYASFLLECPMKYYYMRVLGVGEEKESSINREADNKFYGSVIHRALELGFRADSRRIVEGKAIAENVDIDDGV
jgi:ATP-dependent helicase/nuclease subunit A